MKKSTLIKLLEKYPSNMDIVFKVDEQYLHTARVKINKTVDVFDTEYDEDKDTDVTLKKPKIETSTQVHLELE